MSEDDDERPARPSWRLSPHCFYCSAQLVKAEGGADRRHNVRTRDHINPRARGGPDAAYNLVAACLLCNTLKETTQPMVYWRFALDHVAPYRHDLGRLRAHLLHVRGRRMARVVERFMVDRPASLDAAE
ncbi:HNH endonuclease [Methylobacterium aquaticum]|uniref:HNH domain-containing protein n=1 Tax=Methylobacterium aquaticum TaxID=270351 RepID=A0A0C6G2K8_9HYPH|nr:HNH endonuclease [Methylobacterium aquaticum]BAQ50380.1 hypothetical protein Maq22A_4p60120 [Methylobacterium aquaticum]